MVLPVAITTKCAIFLASVASAGYMGWSFYARRREEAEKFEANPTEAPKSPDDKETKLDEYEKKIASEIVHPDAINITFSDIGGMDDIISSLRESVIMPLLNPAISRSSSTLLAPPKGVLLYGPPGCGKTMLAKALVKESGATVINVTASVLMDRGCDESAKVVAGLFSLARKTQPSVILIDEVDSILRKRRKDDSQAIAMMKAQFMTLWDGLLSGPDQILILGTTNRMRDIDTAFLRRMPSQFAISLPNAVQRKKILSLLLKDVPLAPRFPTRLLAEHTKGKSGSDLKELCRLAVVLAVHESLRKANGDGFLPERGRQNGPNFTHRPLTIEDFFDPDGTLKASGSESDYDI